MSYHNRHLLKNVQEDQFADLTLDKCYPGAYSNMLTLIGRVTAGDSINSYLLSAKREFIQQQAANYITGINIVPGNEIHAANSLYNYVASNYSLLSIEDIYAVQLPLADLTAFASCLSERFTASALVDFVEKSFVIPSKYDYQQMEHILPQRLFEHWASALYNIEGQAADVARTGRLLLLVILQELGFIEKFINEIVDFDHPKQRKKIYQTDNDIFIEEWIEDQITYEPRPLVRVCSNSKEDCELIVLLKDHLKARLSPVMCSRLPLNVLLKLIHTPKVTNSVSSACALTTTDDDTSRLITELCLIDDRGWTGLGVLARYAPDSVRIALALAVTAEDKAKFVDALCQVGGDGWTGLDFVAI
ncbi:hypothetical protein PsalMR5_01434 [Piscirickettsia salmonis]|uniref:hypothetical protein n=1 Tax=Piscirickettsia salmonis TaxID=1238 RepID=UPI0012BAFA7A|nr:hypothetical protein [Piscirickettsia salmonis]QGP54000.1 hypothetical protein PsalSR1_01426 [Piscirickettsia salmonis]QGP60101.1 hypothetical protein PsalBI1_02704 [Piscirickettsia salmonis]QGP63576.1 hypothetical protein PsalMR5_01434 [Piscirickettsia salmonis]